MENKTDNVLVSRKKWRRIINQINLIIKSLGGVTPYGNAPLIEILAMPDFIESDDDLNTVQFDIDGSYALYPNSKNREAQAAINALKYKGE